MSEVPEPLVRFVRSKSAGKGSGVGSGQVASPSLRLRAYRAEFID